MMHPRTLRNAGAAVALLAAGCSFPPPPQQSSAAELQALPPSRICVPNLPVFGRFFYPGDVMGGTYLPPHGSIVMSNDGGWCQIRHIFTFQEVITVGTMSLATPPVHGEVRTGTVGEELRIAYRPQPGFTGSDGFVVHLATPQPWDIPVAVTVVP
jgi:hypothetical protein